MWPLPLISDPLPLGDSVLGGGEFASLRVMNGGAPELQSRHKETNRGNRKERGKSDVNISSGLDIQLILNSTNCALGRHRLFFISTWPGSNCVYAPLVCKEALEKQHFQELHNKQRYLFICNFIMHCEKVQNWWPVQWYDAREIIFSLRLHLFGQKHSKKSNTMKYCSDLKLSYFDIFINSTKLNFQQPFPHDLS